MRRTGSKAEGAGPEDRAGAAAPLEHEGHEQELEALARSLRARDFSQESKVKDSLRAWLVQKAAVQPQPAPKVLRSPGGHAARPGAGSLLIHRAAWGGLFLVLLLAFAWNVSGIAPAAGRPALVTAFLPASERMAAYHSTLPGGLTTHSPRAAATPGAANLTTISWDDCRPSLAPIPVPPSP